VLEGKRSIEVEAMVVEHVGLGRHAVVAPRASSTRVEGNGGDVDETMAMWVIEVRVRFRSERVHQGSGPPRTWNRTSGPVQPPP
jgi:hypothetical protein